MTTDISMDEAALAKLRELAGTGELKLISDTPDEAGAALPESDPHHFVLRDIVSIGEPSDRGSVRAYSEDGSFCEGRPGALLAHLQKHKG